MTVKVSKYKRQDGTEVKAHKRSDPYFPELKFSKKDLENTNFKESLQKKIETSDSSFSQMVNSAKKINSERTLPSQIQDNSEYNKDTYKMTERGVKNWKKHPGKYDLEGIDTPNKETKYFQITAKSKEEYDQLFSKFKRTYQWEDVGTSSSKLMFNIPIKHKDSAMKALKEIKSENKSKEPPEEKKRLLKHLQEKSVDISGKPLINGSEFAEVRDMIIKGEAKTYLDVDAEIQKRYHSHTGLYKNKGKKFDKKRDVVSIAREIRQRISKLPGVKKVSVTTEKYSGGQGINIYFRELTYNPINPDWVRDIMKDKYGTPSGTQYRYIPKANKLLKDAENIVKEYNYDNSDSMTDYYDVNFSPYIKIDDEQYINKIKENIKADNNRIATNAKKQSEQYAKDKEKKEKEFFGDTTQTVILLGNTYPHRKTIKYELKGKWHAEEKGWVVPSASSNRAMNYAKEKGLEWKPITVKDSMFKPLTGEELRAARAEKNQRKADRLKKQLSTAERRSKEYHEKSDSYVKNIPFGQPILVGHHSEGVHRKAIKRSQQNMDRAVEEYNRAERLKSRIKSLEKKPVVKGDAAKGYAKQDAERDKYVKVGSQVNEAIFGRGTVTRVNKKTYSIKYDSGFKTAQPKHFVQAVKLEDGTIKRF